MTIAERITAIDAALDAAYAVLQTGTGRGPLDVQYIQDPDGGQISFRKPTDVLDYIDRLRAERARLVDEQNAETDGVTAAGPVIIVRRRT